MYNCTPTTMEFETMSTATDLERFRDFVNYQLGSAGSALSPEEVLDLWRMEHPEPAYRAASAADVKEALAEVQAGTKLRPAKEVSAEIRQALNLQRPE